MIEFRHKAKNNAEMVMMNNKCRHFRTERNSYFTDEKENEKYLSEEPDKWCRGPGRKAGLRRPAQCDTLELRE